MAEGRGACWLDNKKYTCYIIMKTSEIVEVLSAAKNLNAALKNLIKREGDSNPEVVSFAKDLRARISGSHTSNIESFVEKSLERKRQGFFLGLARYAFADVIDPVVEDVIDRFADTFNTTYERTDTGVVVKLPEQFKEIVDEVARITDEALKAAEIPANSYSRTTMFATVFEADVLEEVQKNFL